MVVSTINVNQILTTLIALTLSRSLRDNNEDAKADAKYGHSDKY